MGHSVVLIEREARLGGHVNTYRDPVTNTTADYGVQIFSNRTVLRNFFKHFEIPLVKLPQGSGMPKTTNFRTAEPVKASDPSAEQLAQALLAYDAQLAKYPGLADGFILPSPVPEDLLLDFGDFLRKYDLEVLANLFFAYNQGAGNILAQPTLYMMKYFDHIQVQDISQSAFVMNGLSDNQLLYDRAQKEPGKNVLLDTDILKIRRSRKGHVVRVMTPGGPKTIHAKKSLLAIPPTVSNLKFLDLDPAETIVFSKLNGSSYWDAVVQDIGIPNTQTVRNIDPEAALDVPALPALYSLSSTKFDKTHFAYYGSPAKASEDEVRSTILDTLRRLRGGSSQDAKIVELHDHTPFMLTAPKEDVAAGFYDKMLALQGHKNTWWTGAAWQLQATAQLWNYTECNVLPRLLAG